MNEYDVGAGLGIFWVVYLAIIAVMLVSMWKIFEKAGKPGWAGIVPIYNMWVLLEIIGKPGWWIVLMLIPCVNIVIMFIVMIELAKCFGKDALFGVLMALFGIIFLPILAFGDAQYSGPASANS